MAEMASLSILERLMMSRFEEGTSIMAFSLSSLSGLFKNFDFFGEATKAITITESIGPLLMKAAVDGYSAASAPNPTSIIQVLADIEKMIPAANAAITANNVHVVESAGGTAVQTQESVSASAAAVAAAQPELVLPAQSAEPAPVI